MIVREFVPLVRPFVIKFFSCHFRGAFSFSVELMGPRDCGAGRNLPALMSTEKPTHTAAMKDKYCSFVRAALLQLFVIAALVVSTTAIAQAPPGSLWYNGDFNDVN